MPVPAQQMGTCGQCHSYGACYQDSSEAYDWDGDGKLDAHEKGGFYCEPCWIGVYGVAPGKVQRGGGIFGVHQDPQHGHPGLDPDPDLDLSGLVPGPPGHTGHAGHAGHATRVGHGVNRLVDMDPAVRRLAQLCNARHLMHASGARFDPKDLRHYRAGKAALNIEAELHHFLRLHFHAWAAAWRASCRVRDKIMFQNGVVKRFRMRVVYKAFREWRPLAAKLAKVKRFLRIHLAHEAKVCFDAWGDFVDLQRAEREATLAKFLFRMRNAEVVRMFARLVLNMKQNRLLRRFVYTMNTQCVVAAFQAWDDLTLRNNAIRLWMTERWLRRWTYFVALEKQRKLVLMRAFVVRMQQAVVAKHFFFLCDYTCWTQNARTVQTCARGFLARLLFQRIRDAERVKEHGRLVRENAFAERYVGEARRLVRPFLLQPTGVNEVSEAAVALRKADVLAVGPRWQQWLRRRRRNAAQRRGGNIDDDPQFRIRTLGEANARGVFQLFAGFAGRQAVSPLVPVDREQLGTLLEGALTCRLADAVVDRAWSLAKHGTNWRLQQGRITIDEFVRVVNTVAAGQPLWQRFRALTAKKQPLPCEKLRVRHTVMGLAERRGELLGLEIYRRWDAPAEECPVCHRPFRFIEDLALHTQACVWAPPTALTTTSNAILDKYELCVTHNLRMRRIMMSLINYARDQRRLEAEREKARRQAILDQAETRRVMDAAIKKASLEAERHKALYGDKAEETDSDSDFSDSDDESKGARDDSGPRRNSWPQWPEPADSTTARRKRRGTWLVCSRETFDFGQALDVEAEIERVEEEKSAAVRNARRLQGRLVVTCHAAEGFGASGATKSLKMDPYMKMWFGDDPDHMKQTKVLPKQLAADPVEFGGEEIEILLTEDDTVAVNGETQEDIANTITVQVLDKEKMADKMLGSSDILIQQLFYDAQVGRPAGCPGVVTMDHWFPLERPRKRGGPTASGSVHLGMTLTPARRGLLVIKTIQGRDLRSMDMFGKQDPFCRFHLGPVTRQGKTDTDGHKTPNFKGEEFEMWIGHDSWLHPLVVECWDEDKGVMDSTDDLIGVHSLDMFPLMYQNPCEVVTQWVPLHVKGTKNKQAGELELEFQFLPAAKLQIQCMGYRQLDDRTANHPFVEFSINHGDIHMMKRVVPEMVDILLTPRWDHGGSVEMDVVHQSNLHVAVFGRGVVNQDTQGGLVGKFEMSLPPIYDQFALGPVVKKTISLFQPDPRTGGQVKAGELDLSFSLAEGSYDYGDRGPYPLRRPDTEVGRSLFDMFDLVETVDNMVEVFETQQERIDTEGKFYAEDRYLATIWKEIAKRRFEEHAELEARQFLQSIGCATDTLDMSLQLMAIEADGPDTDELHKWMEIERSFTLESEGKPLRGRLVATCVQGRGFGAPGVTKYKTMDPFLKLGLGDDKDGDGHLSLEELEMGVDDRMRKTRVLKKQLVKKDIDFARESISFDVMECEDEAATFDPYKNAGHDGVKKNDPFNKPSKAEKKKAKKETATTATHEKDSDLMTGIATAVVVQVWDKEVFKDKLLGTGTMSLLPVFRQSAFGKPVGCPEPVRISEWFPLERIMPAKCCRKKTVQASGDVQLELEFLPSRRGMLVVKTFRGRKLRSMDTFGKQDPYCQMILGSNVRRGKTDTDGSRTPNFLGEEFEFWIGPASWQNEFVVECWDEDIGVFDNTDDCIGRATMPLFNLMYGPPGEMVNQWVPLLTKKGRAAGEVEMGFQFIPAAKLQMTPLRFRKAGEEEDSFPFVEFRVDYGKVQPQIHRMAVPEVFKDEFSHNDGPQKEFGKDKVVKQLCWRDNGTIECDVVQQDEVVVQCFESLEVGKDQDGESKYEQGESIGEYKASLWSVYRQGIEEKQISIYKAVARRQELVGTIDVEFKFKRGAPKIGYPTRRPDYDRKKKRKKKGNNGGDDGGDEDDDDDWDDGDDDDDIYGEEVAFGWFEVENPNMTGPHDQFYYANKETGETMWTRPVDEKFEKMKSDKAAEEKRLKEENETRTFARMRTLMLAADLKTNVIRAQLKERNLRTTGRRKAVLARLQEAMGEDHKAEDCKRLGKEEDEVTIRWRRDNDLNKVLDMKEDELRRELRKREMRLNGSKKKLIARLQEAISEDHKEEDRKAAHADEDVDTLRWRRDNDVLRLNERSLRALQVALKSRNLRTKGKQKVLVDRLATAIREDHKIEDREDAVKMARRALMECEEHESDARQELDDAIAAQGALESELAAMAVADAGHGGLTQKQMKAREKVLKTTVSRRKAAADAIKKTRAIFAVHAAETVDAVKTLADAGHEDESTIRWKRDNILAEVLDMKTSLVKACLAGRTLRDKGARKVLVKRLQKAMDEDFMQEDRYEGKTTNAVDAETICWWNANHVDAVLDLTARQLQQKLEERGLPAQTSCVSRRPKLLRRLQAAIREDQRNHPPVLLTKRVDEGVGEAVSPMGPVPVPKLQLETKHDEADKEAVESKNETKSDANSISDAKLDETAANAGEETGAVSSDQSESKVVETAAPATHVYSSLTGSAIDDHDPDVVDALRDLLEQCCKANGERHAETADDQNDEAAETKAAETATAAPARHVYSSLTGSAIEIHDPDIVDALHDLLEQCCNVNGESNAVTVVESSKEGGPSEGDGEGKVAAPANEEKSETNADRVVPDNEEKGQGGNEKKAEEDVPASNEKGESGDEKKADEDVPASEEKGGSDDEKNTDEIDASKILNVIGGEDGDDDDGDDDDDEEEGSHWHELGDEEVEIVVQFPVKKKKKKKKLNAIQEEARDQKLADDATTQKWGALGMRFDETGRVVGMNPGGKSYAAGLRTGMLLLEVNGRVCDGRKMDKVAHHTKSWADKRIRLSEKRMLRSLKPNEEGVVKILALKDLTYRRREEVQTTSRMTHNELKADLERRGMAKKGGPGKLRKKMLEAIADDHENEDFRMDELVTGLTERGLSAAGDRETLEHRLEEATLQEVRDKAIKMQAMQEARGLRQKVKPEPVRHCERCGHHDWQHGDEACDNVLLERELLLEEAMTIRIQQSKNGLGVGFDDQGQLVNVPEKGRAYKAGAREQMTIMGINGVECNGPKMKLLGPVEIQKALKKDKAVIVIDVMKPKDVDEDNIQFKLLRRALRKRWLPVQGPKKVLIRRLQNQLRKERALTNNEMRMELAVLRIQSRWRIKTKTLGAHIKRQAVLQKEAWAAEAAAKKTADLAKSTALQQKYTAKKNAFTKATNAQTKALAERTEATDALKARKLAEVKANAAVVKLKLTGQDNADSAAAIEEASMGVKEAHAAIAEAERTLELKEDAVEKFEKRAGRLEREAAKAKQIYFASPGVEPEVIVVEEETKEAKVGGDLGYGWFEVDNPNKTGKADSVYYYNKDTKETSWDLGVVEASKKKLHAEHAERVVKEALDADQLAAALKIQFRWRKKQGSVSAHILKVARTEYAANKQRRKTVRRKTMIADKKAGLSAQADGKHIGEGWYEILNPKWVRDDDGVQKFYYVNHDTKKTSWTRPKIDSAEEKAAKDEQVQQESAALKIQYRWRLKRGQVTAHLKRCALRESKKIDPHHRKELGEGWFEVANPDPKTNKRYAFYYTNSHTKQTSWTKPAIRFLAENAEEEKAALKIQCRWRIKKGGMALHLKRLARKEFDAHKGNIAKDKVDLGNGWWKVANPKATSPKNAYYYMNYTTKQTSWTPPGKDGAAPKPKRAGVHKGGGWYEIQNPKSKSSNDKVYYLNYDTKKTAWKLPAEATE